MSPFKSLRHSARKSFVDLEVWFPSHWVGSTDDQANVEVQDPDGSARLSVQPLPAPRLGPTLEPEQFLALTLEGQELPIRSRARPDGGRIAWVEDVLDSPEDRAILFTMQAVVAARDVRVFVNMGCAPEHRGEVEPIWNEMLDRLECTIMPARKAARHLRRQAKRIRACHG